jgi:hypothetical protein
VIKTEKETFSVSAKRRTALQIAETALEASGKSGDFDTDMHRIASYIDYNYNYGESVGSGNGEIILTCVGGAFVLETYSIYEHGIYGFSGYGQIQDDPSATPEHAAFHLNSAPRTYYECNGMKDQL